MEKKVYTPYEDEVYIENGDIYKDEMRLNPYDVDSGRMSTYYDIIIIVNWLVFNYY